MERSCGGCEFWWLGLAPECRRHPPVVSHGPRGPFSTFPRAEADDWCGEFSAKPLPAKPPYLSDLGVIAHGSLPDIYDGSPPPSRPEEGGKEDTYR